MGRGERPPKSLIDFRVTLYALKEYTGWTDVELAKRLGVTDRTVARMRKDPYSANGGNILKVQELLEKAKERY